MTQDLVLGDFVTWKSHSQGTWKEKTGQIVGVVSSHARPDAIEWPALFSGAGPGSARPHESYIVKVGTRVYWPRVSKLTKVPA